MKIQARAAFTSMLLVVCALAAWATGPQAPADVLERGFREPPESARPRVWWHWMNGNITKDGIKADLEWMKRIGIGGVQNFDASLSTPVIVDKRLVFMTPEWKDAFAYAVALADRLGLEFAIAGSPGWSESGGPWVAPAQAMKKFVWSETRVAGGRPFTGALPKPPANAGPFQNAPPGRRASADTSAPAPFYVDAAVVAFPTPEGEVAAAQPTFTIRGSRIEAAALSDGDLTTAVSLPSAVPGEQASIDIDFGRPQAIYGLTLGLRPTGSAPADDPELLASDDGQRFRPVLRIPRGRFPQYTVTVRAVRARYFRVSLRTPAAASVAQTATATATPPAVFEVTELVLHAAPRVNRFEYKAGFATTADLAAFETPPVTAAEAVKANGVIDLTSKMRPDGTLDWTPPPGTWTVLRLGYSLLGITNHPASPEATGLEVDKLDAAAVRDYFSKYLEMYGDASSGLIGKRGLRFIITDSWEAGAQNWTGDMISEFAKRRGYDMRPWLPALAGHVIESAEATDRFLWDFRATIADLTVENHYDQLTALLHGRGMGRYSESHEVRRAMIADGMAVKRTADVPMSAMWTGRGGPLGVPPSFAADIRESASVAHIYGQNLVAAESLTAGSGAYSFSPETLNATADAELSQGVNRFVIHTSVHQPRSDRKPGLGLGPYGQWFTRHETWAEQAAPWITYLARSSYMLQQGRFVADVLYYYGDDTNITALFGEKPPDIPPGYGFDYANSDVILNRLAVSAGRLVTVTGMKYRVLALDPNCRRMTLPVLRKIRELARNGAVVVGPKPVDSPHLTDDGTEFGTIANELWGTAKGPHAVGSGRVYTNVTVAEVLAAEKIVPDFDYSKPQADTALLCVHRALPDGDLYWVNNRQKRAETVQATFRASGRAPELWHADTGTIEPAAYRIEKGRTTVPLDLEPDGAVFVVFRKAAAVPARTLPVRTELPLTTIDGPWTVAFQADRGAPATITLAALVPWNQQADPGVKYFSGTGTYTKTVQAPAAWFVRGARLWLDLGDVKNLAQVSINGKALGILWKPPFRVDVTGALHPGANTVEIAVTNLWVNRLIGDQQPDATTKYTYTAMTFYRADSPLLPSGLLGPVRVLSVSAR